MNNFKYTYLNKILKIILVYYFKMEQIKYLQVQDCAVYITPFHLQFFVAHLPKLIFKHGKNIFFMVIFSTNYIRSLIFIIIVEGFFFIKFWVLLFTSYECIDILFSISYTLYYCTLVGTFDLNFKVEIIIISYFHK